MTSRSPTLTQMRTRPKCTIIILPGSATWFPRQRMPPLLPHLVVLPHNFLGIIVVPMIALNTLSDMSRSEEACAARGYQEEEWGGAGAVEDYKASRFKISPTPRPPQLLGANPSRTLQRRTYASTLPHPTLGERPVRKTAKALLYGRLRAVRYTHL